MSAAWGIWYNQPGKKTSLLLFRKKGEPLMNQRKSSGRPVPLRLCAMLCAWLLCAACSVPAAQAEAPVPTIIVMEYHPVTPAPTEPPPVFVQVYYMTDKGTVLLKTETMLVTSGDVEADAALLPEGYELTGETSVPVKVERGEARPSYVKFIVRKVAETPDRQRELEELRAETEDLRKEVDRQAAALQEKTAAAEALEGENGRLRTENEKLTGQLEEQGSSLTELRAELDEANRKAEQLRTDNNTLTGKLTETGTELSQTQNSLEESRAEAERLRKQAAELEEEITRLRKENGGTDQPAGSTPSGEEAAASVSAGSFREKGSVVTFGRYEQDGDESNGPEAIEWIVLDYDAANHRSLLLSKYGLDAQSFDTDSRGRRTYWNENGIRTWLNGTFLNRAFTAQEKTGILLTKVDNSSSQGYIDTNSHGLWHTPGGTDTEDRIFLLSYAEANRYLGVEYNDSDNIRSRTSPTAYAVKRGAKTDSGKRTEEGAAAGWWWLRSPGPTLSYGTSLVAPDGSLGIGNIRTDFPAIRPAMWVDPESEVFAP